MRRILVGLDGSERQAKVLAAAVDLARATDARLWLVRAVGIPAEMPRQALAESPDRLADILRDLAQDELQRAAKTLPSGMEAVQQVVVGTPWRALCDAAAEVQASLMVIGSHGYQGIDRLLGTTAAKVVNHAPCSVLVVR